MEEKLNKRRKTKQRGGKTRGRESLQTRRKCKRGLSKQPGEPRTHHHHSPPPPPPALGYNTGTSSDSLLLREKITAREKDLKTISHNWKIFLAKQSDIILPSKQDYPHNNPQEFLIPPGKI